VREEEAQKKAIIEQEAERERVNMSKAQKDIYEERCFECKAVNCIIFKESEGTQVCTNCGVVAQISVIDQTLEKRNYTSEVGGSNSGENRVNSSVGNRWAPDQVPDTVISGTKKEKSGLNLNSH